MFTLSGYALQFGPNCCCREYVFEILTPDLQPTGGKVSNVFPGCNCRGLFTRADNLEVLFPQKATPEQRAALVGAGAHGGEGERAPHRVAPLRHPAPLFCCRFGRPNRRL